ncbi:MAG: GNVR domain-containing protein, partial [Cucumibacter sp.]
LPESAPEAVDLRAELARLDQELRRTARIELGSLRDSLAQSQGALSDLRGSIRNAALSAELPTDLLTTVYSLQQEASVARSQYQVLLSRLRDVEAQADLQLAEARIVSPALEPSGPSFPRVSLILAVATMFSLALGIGIAYLRENYVGGFVSDRQVESVLRLPTSVSVPRLRTHDDTGELALLSPADAIVTAPISQYSERVRRIGASVDQLLRSREPGSGSARGSVLMVCSAIPGEGKSTLALSLGRSYALSGKRPILIDCDLRKPSIHRHLGIQPSRGLYEFLASHGQQIKFSDIVVRDSQTLLAMAIGARGSGTPTDHLVFGTAFEHLVESAAAAFDTVILDTPP